MDICPDCLSAKCAHNITPRQASILRLLAEGLSNKDIASRLGLTHGTAKAYISALFVRIGVVSRFQAALWAVRHAGLLQQFRPVDVFLERRIS